jgi:hypothetical protein
VLLPRRLLAAVTLSTALVVLVPGIAHAVVPLAPVRLPVAIEGFATYQKQTTCSPTAKPGTTKLKNLLLKTYPGTRNLGIVRACSAGGASEHKEGRAFDWGVRVNNRAEAAKASAFITWLLKADARGNKAANARRLGIMYVIWNKRIWGAYSAGSGWRAYTGSSPHTDHVHISLSRSGAAGTTSFWTGRVNAAATTPTSGWGNPSTPTYRPPVPPKPVVPLVPVPVPPKTLPTGTPLQDETLVVKPTLAGVLTASSLVKGQRYRVEVRGSWRWNRETESLADGECSTEGGHWSSRRELARVAGDQLGLYLDGRDLQLATYRDNDCAAASHTYTATIVAPRWGRVPLRLWEPATAKGYADNTGALTVRIIRDAARDTLPVTLNVKDRWGTTTGGSVVAGQRYDIAVTGEWSPSPGVLADATCVSTPEGQRQPGDYRDRRWMLRVGDEWLAARCRPDHTYGWSFVPERSGPVVVKIEEEDHEDNSGSLRVVLTRVVEEPPQ